ncbi:MAG: FecR family protein [Syntrophaceae bacterium]
MKKLILIASALLFVLCGIAEAKRVVPVNIGKGECRVTTLNGTAKCSVQGGSWVNMKAGQLLKGGDQVETGPNAKMEITLPDGSLLRFAGNARFKIVAIDMDEKSGTRSAKINVALGKTWANVNKGLKIKPNIDVASDNAVAGVRGTVYRMNVDQDQSVLVRVYDGEVKVEGGGKGRQQDAKPPLQGPPQKVSGPSQVQGPTKVSMEQWVFIVKSMQQIRVSSAGVPSKPESFTAREDRDEWVDWNKGRDQEADNPAGKGKGKSWLDRFK